VSRERKEVKEKKVGEKKEEKEEVGKEGISLRAEVENLSKELEERDRIIAR
jgi:hypothetical protein